MLNADGKLTIDLGAVRENWRILQKQVGPHVRIAPAVKANAYGLGLPEITTALHQEGCTSFFVAKPAEGIALRAVLPESCDIYILNGFYQSYADAYTTHRLTPVIGSFMEIDEYKALGKDLPAFLKFNTRMNRLGFAKAEQDKLWEEIHCLDGIDVRGVMSHLACADEPDNPMNRTQLELFQEIAARFPGAQKSLANSSGIFLGEEYHFDMVRPGYALYGGNPTPQKDSPMKPVVSINIPVIRTRKVFKDAVIGYNGSYRFEKDSWVATLAAGYADGLFRSLSNVGALYWNGVRCPIRGRISMDLTTVDLSDVPEGQRPKPGDYMELLGPHQTIDDLGHDAGTIGYEVLTHLSGRYERTYKN